MDKRECPICGGIFQPEYPNNQYCGNECQCEARKRTIKKYEDKRRLRKERREYTINYMKKNGWKYNTGSKYTNKGRTVQFKLNKDGTKDFRNEGKVIRSMSLLLLGKTRITDRALEDMKNVR